MGQDGLSLTPLLLDPTTVHRETLYSETDRLYGNVGGVALRGDRYKIIVQDDGVEAMFDLTTDPWEEHDLIDQLGDDEALQAAYDDLLDYLVVLHGGTVDTEGDSGSENGCSGCGATPRPPSLVWSLALLGVALRRRS